jgi:hypothetical protein
MHHRLLAATVMLAVAATVALAGCTSVGAGGVDTAGTAHSTAEPQAAAETPFTPYWNAMYGVHDAADEVAKREKVEKLVAACMTAEGFDYIPVDQNPPEQVTDYMDAYGTAEWAAKHGYGAFPTDDETAQMDEQIASEDPNGDYVASLSDGEIGAYYEALQGPPTGRDDVAAMKDGDVPEYDWEGAGCLGRAQHEVLGDDPTQSARFEPLVAAMNALEQDQLADPAMAPIDAEWSECMAAAGFAGLPTKQSAVDAVFAQSTDYWDSGATDEPTQAMRAGWREYEIDVAVADFDCAETVGFADKSLAVQVARENQFVADNRAELDELLAELAQRR